MSQTLYRFRDVAGDLLYVGVSMNPPARWGQHRQDKPWWSEVATVSLEIHESREAVEAAERRAIVAERPRYNIAHHPDRRDYSTHDGPCVGSAELAAMLNVSRQRVSQLTGQPDFPAPVASLVMGRIWRTEDVRAWAESKGREIHE